MSFKDRPINTFEMSDLFRKEVLDKQGQKLFGDIILASPISHIAMTGLLAVIISGLLVFAIVGEYSRKERVVGFLTPDKGLIRVLPRQSGVIENIEIRIGDRVKKGDKLFSVKLDTISGTGFDTAGTLLTQLQAEKNELQRRRDLIPQQYSLTRNRLKGQIEAAKAESERLSARIVLQERSVQNERVVFEKFQQLILQEAASSLEASSQENRYLQASQSLETLRNEKQRFEDNAADLEAQYRLLPITEQQEISEITSRLSALEQRVTQTQGQERYIITAPISGRLASLNAKEGQLASTQRALATILPAEGKLEAELLVPSRAAGFVQEGQTVRLLYDAFPYQKFGFHSGTVSKVSRTVINATDLSIAPNTQEPIFIITVELNRQDIDANNDIYDLQAGMTLAADIILEDRKIWEWVFEPILGAAKK